MPILNALNNVGLVLSKAPCIILAKPLNITLITTDNRVSGISDTRIGDMKAIIANTIATAPKRIFVKGVTFLLRPDGFLFFSCFLLLIEIKEASEQLFYNS